MPTRTTRTMPALAVALALAACVTRKEVDTSIDIAAPRAEVYEVLADFRRYDEWNPYHVRVAGLAEKGAQLDVRVSRPDGVVVDVPHVRVLQADPGEALAWGGGIAGLFRGEHRFDLAEAPDGGTRLRHTEVFSGLFIGYADLPVPVLTEGYELMNRALKTHVESGAHLRRPRQHPDGVLDPA